MPSSTPAAPNTTSTTNIYITFKVAATDASHPEVAIRIKKTTRLHKLYTVYALRRGVDTSSVRLLFEGKRIAAHQAVGDIGLEEGDEVDALLEVDGGGV